MWKRVTAIKKCIDSSLVVILGSVFQEHAQATGGWGMNRSLNNRSTSELEEN